MTAALNGDVVERLTFEYERRIWALECVAEAGIKLATLMRENTTDLDDALTVANAVAERHQTDRYVVKPWIPLVEAVERTAERVWPEENSRNEAVGCHE